MKHTFLVTGGAGFIGTNLVHFLIEQGHTVKVVDNLTAGKRERLPDAIQFHKLDILDTAGLGTVCEGVDVMVHLAALPRLQFSIDHPQIAHEVNITGTLSVLEAARSAGVKRIVYAASSSAYGDQETLPLTTDLEPQPKTPYALQKYVGEAYMKLWSDLFGLQTVSLRFFNVYGPHLDPDGAYALVIGRFLKLAAEGQPLTIVGDGEQTRDFTHVRDVVSALYQASLSDQVGNGEVFNVGAGIQTTINELTKLIGGEVTYVPARIEAKHSLADIEATKKVLNWEPKVRLEDGIAELKAEFGLL